MKQDKFYFFLIIFSSLFLFCCSEKTINGLYVSKNQFDENTALYSKNKFNFDKRKKRFEYRLAVEQNATFSYGKYRIENDALILTSDINTKAFQLTKDSLPALRNDSIEINFVLNCGLNVCDDLFEKYIVIDDLIIEKLSSKDTINLMVSNESKQVKLFIKMNRNNTKGSNEFYSEIIPINSNQCYKIYCEFKSNESNYRTFLNDTILNFRDKLYLVKDSVWFYKFNLQNKNKFIKNELE